ncbi:MAG: endonuclease/exonuclease/phosphatase family protein [Burkholderiales bacterium]|nr:endonuclease/exonuclease/phosphatase family protein [Burkholderiales bacterium]
MNPTLTIATYNIHKGMSALNRKHVLPALKRELDGLGADLVFLQEVQGAHDRRARRHTDWPDEPQHAYLAGDHHHAYGRNADYQAGHHGNALLSRFPIVTTHNEDLSLHRLERRGLLHAELAGASGQPIHALCVHLNLRAGDRRKQIGAVVEYIHDAIPTDAPLVLAGDFNDWRGEACHPLHHALGLTDAYLALHGQLAPSFPAHFPVLPLDRIYLRGFHVERAQVHSGRVWRNLSDHVPLSATVRLTS